MGKKLAALARCAFLVSMMAGPAVQAGDPTLVGWWEFDEGVGKTVRDSSGYGHEGVLVGDPRWVAGKIGSGALSFDGSDGLVQVPESPALDARSTLTITAWVNLNSLATFYFVACKAPSGTAASNYPGNYEFRVASGTGILQLLHQTSQGQDLSTYASTTPIAAGQWRHVAVTFQVGGRVEFYIDGTSAGGAAQTSTFGILNDEPVRIGGRKDNYSYFNGLIDDVRIYSRALTPEDLSDVLLGKGPNKELADDPAPEDKATDVPQDALLSWTPGEFAATHDVYIGTSFADVNTADRTNPKGTLVSQGQTAAAYDGVELLEFGAVYYWRVDEVNAAPDNTIFKGEVWSFTVEPFSYPITNAVATASSQSRADTGPQNTVNGSGLNAADQHSVELTQMWMSGNNKPHWVQYEFDKVYKLDELWVWNSNQIVEAFVGFGAKNVTIEYSVDGAAWTALEGAHEFARAPGAATYAANTFIDFGGVEAKFVKLTISSNWGGIAQTVSLSEVRFFYVPVQAFKPQPAVGATNVSVMTDLNWRPGREATSHKVAIGTDSAAVAAGAGAQTVTEHTYAPADLSLGTQYFWKVDALGDASEYAGDLWNFTTEAYTIVDDFESYKDDIDAENTIWHAWIDGLTDKANGGSQVGYDQAPFAEKTVVRSGGQAMPLMYDNSASAFSEAKRMFDPAQNWTAHGAKTLSVHFAGAGGNTGKLYLKINNTKVAYTGEDKDLARAGWQAWNIDLTTIAGVASVRSLTIGVEGSGAKGKLYFDDIRLAAKAPEFSNPVEPDSANLIARHAFEGDVKDSSGKGRNGTANGGPTFVAGVDGQALHLDGTDDFVVVGSVGISGAAPRTISGWVKADTTTITDWTNIFGFTSSPTGIAGQSFDMNKQGGANQYCIHAYGWERNIMAIDLEWHHLAATYDGTTVAWYGDGQFVASEVWVLNTQDLVHMGKRAHAAGGNFPGSLDEVRIYNKALSADEIAWLAGRRLPVHKAQ